MGVYRCDCPHCGMDSMTFTVTWSSGQPGGAFVGVATCNGCNLPICFRGISVNSMELPHSVKTDIARTHRVDEYWPRRRKPDAPSYTPQAVAKRFIEGEDGFSRRNWNSAVAMYRSALDIATKAMDGVDPKESFFVRLKTLHDQHRITPDIKEWADHVRIEGNAALHDPEDFDENDAKALRFFTEMFLRYVYELPGKVRDFRGEPDPTGGKT